MEATSTGPLIPRRRLGAAFRDLRESRGETLQTTARALMFSPSKLSRIENGLGGEPNPRDVRDMINHFDLDGTEQATALVELADAGRVPGWWQVPPYEMPARLDTFISYESAATRIEAYVPLAVPGMLQTRAYATAVVNRLAPQLTQDETTAQVDLRLRRQRELRERDTPPMMRFTIPETVLRRRVGSGDVMSEQLAVLLRAYDDPHIDLHVIPFEAGLYLAVELATLTHFHFSSELDPDVMALELGTSIQFLDGKDRIRRHRDAFAELAEVQLDRAKSREFIAGSTH